MGEGAVSPDRGPPVRAEIVHSSERTRVTRLFLSGRTLIRKEPLGADAERRLQQEAAILHRVRGVSGVAQLVDIAVYGVHRISRRGWYEPGRAIETALQLRT